MKIPILRCPHCGKEFPSTSDADVLVHCQKNDPKLDLTKHLQEDACECIGEVEIPDKYIMAKFRKKKRDKRRAR